MWRESNKLHARDQTVLHTLVNVCGFSCGFLCTVGRYNHKRISDSGALGDLLTKSKLNTMNLILSFSVNL